MASCDVIMGWTEWKAEKASSPVVALVTCILSIFIVEIFEVIDIEPQYVILQGIFSNLDSLLIHTFVTSLSSIDLFLNSPCISERRLKAL